MGQRQLCSDYNDRAPPLVVEYKIKLDPLMTHIRFV